MRAHARARLVAASAHTCPAHRARRVLFEVPIDAALMKDAETWEAADDLGGLEEIQADHAISPILVQALSVFLGELLKERGRLKGLGVDWKLALSLEHVFKECGACKGDCDTTVGVGGSSGSGLSAASRERCIAPDGLDDTIFHFW
eukprot:m.16354 g.16354  ORF g.16354 m.16354 type:complete len:146 (-) comp3127_c0_seq1:372-809(-)